MDTQNKPKANRNENLAALVECAVMIALAYVLGLFPIWTLPNGGSITAVSMLPLVLLGLRRGPKWSFPACLVYGFLQFALGPKYAFSLISLFCDYILAFGAIGLAGLFRGKSWGIWAAIPVSFFGRFVFHFISGVTVWASYAPEGMPVWLYSLTYNGSYMGVELVLTLAVAVVLRFALPRLLTA